MCISWEKNPWNVRNENLGKTGKISSIKMFCVFVFWVFFFLIWFFLSPFCSFKLSSIEEIKMNEA